MTGHELTIGGRQVIGREIPPYRSRSIYAMGTARPVYGYHATCSCGAGSLERTKAKARTWHAGHIVAVRNRQRDRGTS